MMPSAAPFATSKSKQASVGGGCGGTGATAGLLPPAQGLKCPRCNSPNTKFCYYNNYSLAQPRYFCKSCRRYWTKGGALRNVPVGGGCRKSKNNSKSYSPSSIAGCNNPVPELTSPMGFPVHRNYSSIASSIESLSCINQDLHWRLQQQRLQVMYFGGGGQVAPRVEGNSTASATSGTAWFLDGSLAAMNDGDDGGCRNGGSGVGEWAGIRDWSDMQQFTVLP